MSLLRLLRNLAVLVIFTVTILSLTPRPVAAQSSCQPLGSVCGSGRACCPGSLCGPHRTCCDKPFYSMYCNTSAECCTGLCLNHRCN